MSKKYFNVAKNNREAIGQFLDEINENLTACYSPYGSLTLIATDKGMFPTKDGNTILNHMNTTEPVAAMVMSTIRDISADTMFTAGDGTTTATLLTSRLFRNLNNKYSELINKYCLTPQEFSSKLEECATKICTKIKEESFIPESIEELISVARVSLNGDEKIVNHFKEAYDLSGNKKELHLIAKPDFERKEITLDVRNGYKSDHSLATTLLGAKAKLDDAIIMSLNDGPSTPEKIKEFNEILLKIEENLKSTTGKKFVLLTTNVHMAARVDFEEWLQHLNKKYKYVPSIYLFELSSNGTTQEFDKYENLNAAIKTMPMNIEVFNKNIEKDLANGFKDYTRANCDINMDGIVFDTIVGGSEKILEGRINYLESRIKSIKGTAKEKLIQMEIDKLKGSVGIINIGARTEKERNRLITAIEDAVLAISASKKHGVVVGSNLCVPKVINKLELANEIISEIDKEFYGVILNVYKELFEIICKNAGIPSVAEELFKGAYKDESMINGINIKKAKKQFLGFGEEGYTLLEYSNSKEILNASIGEIAMLKAAVEIVSQLITANQVILEDNNEASRFETLDKLV